MTEREAVVAALREALEGARDGIENVLRDGRLPQTVAASLRHEYISIRAALAAAPLPSEPHVHPCAFSRSTGAGNLAPSNRGTVPNPEGSTSVLDPDGG